MAMTKLFDEVFVDSSPVPHRNDSNDSFTPFKDVNHSEPLHPIFPEAFEFLDKRLPEKKLFLQDYER